LRKITQKNSKKTQETAPAAKKRKVAPPTAATTTTTTAVTLSTATPEAKKPVTSSAFFTCAGFAQKATEDDLPIKKTKKKVTPSRVSAYRKRIALTRTHT
jgi:hypothetical protein